MIVGSLGKVVFTVSPDQVLTFRNLSRERSARSSVHDTLAGLPRLQHTGRNLDKLAMTVVLHRASAADGTPDKAIGELMDMVGQGEAVPLVLGIRYFRKWFLQSVSVNHKIIHHGITWRADVALTLTEYN